MNTVLVPIPDSPQQRVLCLLRAVSNIEHGASMSIVLGEVMTDIDQVENALIVDVGGTCCVITQRDAEGIIKAARMLKTFQMEKTARYRSYLILADALEVSLGHNFEGVDHGNRYLH